MYGSYYGRVSEIVAIKSLGYIQVTRFFMFHFQTDQFYKIPILIKFPSVLFCPLFDEYCL